MIFHAPKSTAFCGAPKISQDFRGKKRLIPLGIFLSRKYLKENIKEIVMSYEIKSINPEFFDFDNFMLMMMQ